MAAQQPLDRPLIVLGDLAGPDGNAFVIMARCHQAWREFHKERGTLRSGLEAPGEKPDAMRRFDEIAAEMQSGDYEHLLAVVDREFVVLQPVKAYEQVSLLDQATA